MTKIDRVTTIIVVMSREYLEVRVVVLVKIRAQ